MTIAERLRQEGHQIGWQEGKLEGMHEQAIKLPCACRNRALIVTRCSRPTQLSEADLAANNH